MQFIICQWHADTMIKDITFFPLFQTSDPPPPPHPQLNLYLLLPMYNLFTEIIFCESVDNAQDSQIFSTFQEAD